MGLVLGLAEFGLFLTFAAVCVALVITVIFSLLSMAFMAVGLAFDTDLEDVVPATVATMVVWAATLVIGGLCSALGRTALWDVSPFGWLQATIRQAIQPYFAPAAHRWASDYSGMWATFWSFNLVSLLFAIILVVIFALWSWRTA